MSTILEGNIGLEEALRDRRQLATHRRRPLQFPFVVRPLRTPAPLHNASPIM